jgi:hypothetical protein
MLRRPFNPDEPTIECVRNVARTHEVFRCREEDSHGHLDPAANPLE